MLTNVQLVEFVTKAYNAKWVYWYGTYGKKCTQSLYNSKKKQYPDHYTSSRTSKYMKQISEGRWCADCIGLGKAFVWSNGVFEGTPKYASNGMPDKSANGMFSYAKSHGAKYGKIATIPEIPGLAVRMDGHVGYYVGKGYVIEERGFAYGCVKTALKDRKWTDWYELPGVTYVDEPAKEPVVAPEPEPTTQPDGSAYINVRHGSYYVRTEPNTNSSSFGVVRTGDHIPYLGKTENGWFNVEYKNRSGWVSSKCGDLIADEKTYFTIKSGTWNIRKGPSTSYEIYGVLHGGERVEYLGETKNNWYKVRSAEYEGWVSGMGINK